MHEEMQRVRVIVQNKKIRKLKKKCTQYRYFIFSVISILFCHSVSVSLCLSLFTFQNSCYCLSPVSLSFTLVKDLKLKTYFIHSLNSSPMFPRTILTPYFCYKTKTKFVFSESEFNIRWIKSPPRFVEFNRDSLAQTVITI